MDPSDNRRSWCFGYQKNRYEQTGRGLRPAVAHAPLPLESEGSIRRNGIDDRPKRLLPLSSSILTAAGFVMKQEIYPKDFRGEVNKRLDFEWAYNALEGYEHYHTYSIRGVMRMLQLRNDEALAEFDAAEQRFPEPKTDPARYNFIMTQRATIFLMQEAQDPSDASAERTDKEMERIEQFAAAYDDPKDERENIVRIASGKLRAAHHIARGRFAESLELSQRTISQCDSPEQPTLAYVLAATACHELGLFKQSRRHYENVELCMAFYPDRIFFCMAIARLMSMSKYWGWEGEYQRWLQTLDAMDCPPETRDLMFQRFELLFGRCKSGKPLVLA